MLAKGVPKRHGYSIIIEPLQWRHNDRDCVSNHQCLNYLLNRLFRRRLKKISKLRVSSLCEWNSPVTGEFPAKRDSNAENVFIWWRHHAIGFLSLPLCIECSLLENQDEDPIFPPLNQSHSPSFLKTRHHISVASHELHVISNHWQLYCWFKLILGAPQRKTQSPALPAFH